MVVTEGTKSTKEAVTSGVPQGTVLGPVLFLVLIADIAKGTDNDTRITSFADDTRASREIKGNNDYSKLQSDLNTIYGWAREVNMEFNGDKFEVLRCWPDVTNWSQHLPFQLKNEHIYKDCKGDFIEEKEHVKDLGIMLSSDLSFSHHIKKLVKTCQKQIGYILRTFNSRTKLTMLTLWKSMIQSRLDYCSQLYSPSSAGEIKQLENIQRAFTARIQGMQDMNYRERLTYLRLYSQERRRERYCIIFIWKIAMGLVDGYKLTISDHGRQGRLCDVKKIPRLTQAQVRNAIESSLGVKGAKLFNSIPAKIRNINSDKVNVFKRALDNYLSGIPDEPTIEEQGRAAETNSLLHQIPRLMK